MKKLFWLIPIALIVIAFMRIPIKKLKGTTTYKSPAQEIETPRDIVDVSKILTVEKNGVERDKKIDELLDLFFLKDNALSLVSGEMKSPNFVKEKKGWLVNALGEAYFNKIIASNIKTFDATVGGSNSDYVTLGAAIEAGKSNILISGDTTETGDISVPSGGFSLTIEKGVTVDMGDYQFTYSEAADVVIQGSGILKYTFTTEKDLFDNASYPTSVLDIKDITIDNQSTAVSNLSDDGVIIKADNIIFLCPDTLFSTINLDNPESVLSNSKIVGRAGGSCLSYGGNYLQGKVNNVLYTGPFIFLIAIGSKATVNNIIINSTSSQATVDVEGGGQLSNMVSVGSSQVDLEVDDGSCVTNINLDGGNVQANMNEPTDKTSIISNLYTTGNIIHNSYNAIISNSHFGRVNSSTSSNLILNGVDFTGNVTITGDKNRFVNCTIRGAVSDAGDDNSWIGCQVGADAGGGSNTITITAAANRTIVDGTRTDAAISDAGSGTVLGDNVVY